MQEALERLLEEDIFSVYTPGDGAGIGGFTIMEKSDRGVAFDEVKLEDERPIHGYCSTERLDRQQEVVVQRGLDFTEFTLYGYFNDNHQQQTAAVLGWPTMAELQERGWYTQGHLFKSYHRSDEIWQLAKAIRASNAPRRLGFSIEGKVLERSGGNRIVRAKVRNVAITNCPVNTDCSWGILAKAFAPPDAVIAAADRAYSARKALVAGYGFRDNGGAALRVESVEGQQERVERNEDIDFKEAVRRVQSRHPTFSRSMCLRIARAVMLHS